MMSAALVSLLCCVGVVYAIPPGSQACSSQMPGDTAFTMCGAFCKPEKASKICSYCKCKTCQYCGGTQTPPAEPRFPKPVTAAAAAAGAALTQAPKKKKVPVMTAAPAPTPAPVPAPATTGVAPKKGKKKPTSAASPPPPPPGPAPKCSSKQFGDTNFELCAPFCKSDKASGHCKFCKCKACAFCKHVEL